MKKMIICLLLTFRDSFVPNEIDTYFTMMDKNQDNKLSKEEIQDGFTLLRYFIFMSHFIIQNLIPKYYVSPRQQCSAVLVFFKLIDAHDKVADCIGDRMAGDRKGISLEQLKECINDMRAKMKSQDRLQMRYGRGGEFKDPR